MYKKKLRGRVLLYVFATKPRIRVSKSHITLMQAKIWPKNELLGVMLANIS
jgi:hypothetical protein